MFRGRVSNRRACHRPAIRCTDFHAGVEYAQRCEEPRVSLSRQRGTSVLPYGCSRLRTSLLSVAFLRRRKIYQQQPDFVQRRTPPPGPGLCGPVL
eukprot:scaffold70538_cov56-Phaeocystis_antarctica.AAC.2